LAAAADQGPPPEQEMVNQEKVALVRRIIGSLSPDERDVLTSYYIEGESQAEIAARLGQTINAVKSKLNRIRIKLREQFSEEIAPFLQFL
jgi:RNA polymerase sigma factor (sigma-70 family)